MWVNSVLMLTMSPTDTTSQALSERDCRYIQQVLLALVGYGVTQDCPTAPEIVNYTGLKLDVVKKKLKQLSQFGVVEAISYTPKRYRLNTYELTPYTVNDTAMAVFADAESAYYVPNFVSE